MPFSSVVPLTLQGHTLPVRVAPTLAGGVGGAVGPGELGSVVVVVLGLVVLVALGVEVLVVLDVLDVLDETDVDVDELSESLLRLDDVVDSP